MNTGPYTVKGRRPVLSDGIAERQCAKRAQIAIKARKEPKTRFDNLLHHLTYELVEECLNNIPLTSAPGVDGMSVAQARENLSWLLPPMLQQIHQGEYQAPAVRRVYIPKATRGMRPLGVPEVIDRAIQAATVKILNEIYEQDFLRYSFGFRPKLGCHHALATVSAVTKGAKMYHAFEVDIRDFFGSITHEWMMKFLGHRISDKRVLKLVEAWLKAGVMEQGRWRATEQGTPQGGSVSPLLANIYLHYVLDLWWDKKINPKLRDPLRYAHLVRYADDFIIFFRNPNDAKSIKPLLQARLNQFGLKIAEEKSCLTDLTPNRPNKRNGSETKRRVIKFLGLTMGISNKRAGGPGTRIWYRTDNRRFTRAKARMKETLRRIMHWSEEDQAERINAIVRGHSNYYGLPGNSSRIRTFRDETIRYWRRCLSRRSQKGHLTWKGINQLLERHPVTKANLKLTYADLPAFTRL